MGIGVMPRPPSMRQMRTDIDSLGFGTRVDPRIVWIMLNPSSATAAEVDPTINRILRFSKRWGHGAAEVVNLFALRATDPNVLKRHFDPVGPPE